MSRNEFERKGFWRIQGKSGPGGAVKDYWVNPADVSAVTQHTSAIVAVYVIGLPTPLLVADMTLDEVLDRVSA